MKSPARSETMREATLWIAFLSASMADIASTMHGLCELGATEANPLFADIACNAESLAELAAAKLIALTLLVLYRALDWGFTIRGRRYGWETVVTIGILLTTAAALLNTMWTAGLIVGMTP